ncbi:transcription factor E [Methanobacterium oryzae]|uniref:transcription factor E n=1 Tax=Methanobacterium oryzae TaxID=69540 RepID=UPI003D219158
MINGPVTQEILKSSLSKEGVEILNEPLVQEFIHDITKDNENSISIIKCLLEGKLTDEEISEEIELRLNIVRRILYKLYDAGIASYKRSKDPETQWYTYSWTFEKERVIKTIAQNYEENSREMEEYLAYEEDNMFFACINGCRYNFEEASEHNFMCPECEQKLEYQDNSSKIIELREQMS